MLYEKALDSTKSTPFTPNISFVCALKKALEMIKKEGIENVVSRHNRLKERLRLGVRRIGLKLLVENDKEASSAITAIYPPSGISVADVRKAYAQDWDLKVADGQLDLKGKIFRVGHLGFVSDRDIEMTLTVTEKVMQKLKTNS
ncbi:MAG: alanine--glyoxylate aminotransferase family protein [Candidatus Melainabacteria bacterium]|nr:alanine--glyoxylate aminotransferase family protein [Candidatus Melainabacteria bacterium]